MASPSQHKNTILITGGTTGLGYACAENLSRRFPDHQIIIASRSNTNSASETINASTRQNNVAFLPLDLSNLVKVRDFATDYKKRNFPPLSTLILNAALQFPGPVQYSTDGIESTFAISHVGHALLLHLLTPHLTKHARIIVVTSGTHDPAQKTGLPDAHYTSAEELAHPSEQSKRDNNGRQRYATTKLCGVLWAYALHDRLASTGKSWTVVAYDPGLMPGTGLARDATRVERFLWHHVLPHVIPVLRLLLRTGAIYTPQTGGANLAEVAMGEKWKNVNGKYVQGSKEMASSVESHDKGKQEELWGWTVGFVGRDDGEREAWKELK